MSPEDRRILDLFAVRVRALAPSAAIWAFGSRARGSAHPESDFDLCLVVPEVTRELRDGSRQPKRLQRPSSTWPMASIALR